MLYTVRPLERIYTDLNCKVEEKPQEIKMFETEHGQIYAKKCEDKYIIDQLVSSEMSDYLKEEYQPGSEYFGE